MSDPSGPRAIAPSLEVGMDAHLTKPYTREQLREILSTWLA